MTSLMTSAGTPVAISSAFRPPPAFWKAADVHKMGSHGGRECCYSRHDLTATSPGTACTADGAQRERPLVGLCTTWLGRASRGRRHEASSSRLTAAGPFRPSPRFAAFSSGRSAVPPPLRLFDPLVPLDDPPHPHGLSHTPANPGRRSQDVVKMGDEPEVDYYAVVGVASTADAQEIRTAYRKASLAVHPDRVRTLHRRFVTTSY